MHTHHETKEEGNVLFNDALNTFYLRLYGVGHMVKDHSDSKRGNPLPPHRLLFPIICIIPQDNTYHRIIHTTAFVTPVVEHWLERHETKDRQPGLGSRGRVSSCFSFQPVLRVWCNKGRCMCYPVCGMVHIKEPLLLIGKSSPRGGSGFPLSLSQCLFAIRATPYNRK